MEGSLRFGSGPDPGTSDGPQFSSHTQPYSIPVPVVLGPVVGVPLQTRQQVLMHFILRTWREDSGGKVAPLPDSLQTHPSVLIQATSQAAQNPVQVGGTIGRPCLALPIAADVEWFGKVGCPSHHHQCQINLVLGLSPANPRCSPHTLPWLPGLHPKGPPKLGVGYSSAAQPGPDPARQVFRAACYSPGIQTRPHSPAVHLISAHYLQN